jgi:fructose-1,6-bisphosphatase/inositol monophosphatase family enzyme
MAEERSAGFALPFDIAEALAVLEAASVLALELHGSVRAEVKEDQTLVTEADKRLEAFLRAELAQLAPGWSFLGEEEGLTGDPNAPCWVIDPIDGTTNFVRGIPLWCISVGAVFDGTPIFGMLKMPELDEVLWAAPGQGAWRILRGETTRVFVEDRLPIMQEDPIAANTTVERILDFRHLANRLRNFGALAYHLCLLSRGAIVANIAHYHKLYDVAAGMCVCFEAGCEARYLDGTLWRADVKTDSETQPLLTAPPLTLQYLLENLRAKEQPEILEEPAPVREDY